MILLIIQFCIISLVSSQDDRFELNILHYNDFHARFVETSPSGGVCNPNDAPCIGGFARLTTVVREAKAREPHSLLLNAGDSFQGTIWYNLLRWNVTQDFMNMLPHDAHVLGNHEFDNGIDGVVPYLRSLESPVVTANIIDDREPTIQGLYQSSIVIEREGRQIGIIGVIISTTDELASTGQLEFTDEIETVRREAEKLNELGVNIIIVLSHCGLDIDREIALHGGPHIDIVVGGHSHTLLYNDEAPNNSGFIPQGPYPVIIDQETRKVLIVQAAAHTQYLGEIKLHFDDAGNLLEWEGHPHYIGNEIEQDITFESVLLSTPFENNVEVFDLRGDHILEMLEYSVANVPYPGARMLQVSGLRNVFDNTRPVNNRALNVTVRCIECDVPRYEPLQLDKYYKVVSQSFIGEGGDGFTMLSENRVNVEVVGVDYDVLMTYIAKQSPVFRDNDGRIEITNPCQN
ncbi:apyrase isoform X2 [Pectinophora gossypiella]|uniref:apyrase isoform X2 n=1 Tax=Pectinophora gossypiella TaxID=13191 RepID=UPI00214E121F|nr:apyrase isoform X2 [Pectinophora gossypiella]